MIIAECRNIKKHFPVKRGYLKTAAGIVKAVDGVTLAIERGQSFGLVGESGCGKTTLGKMILGIVKPDSGEVILNTSHPQVIFQDPFNSLDPKMKVRDILAEALFLRGDKKDAEERLIEAADLVKMPAQSLMKYPHEFSGGERQRIAIARAVITRPEFIVCDEPVSNLDVTIQLQVLNLLKDIRQKFGISYLFISHDLKIIRYMCDKVAVMKDGKIIEEGETGNIYSSPSQEYTRILLSSVIKCGILHHDEK